MSSDINACGIETFADMEFYFHIFDGDWNTVLDSELIQVKTSAADGYSYSYDDTGEELYNDGGIRIVSKGISEGNSIFGPGLILFIENTSGQSITVQSRNTSVNGFMVETIMSEEVAPNKRSITDLTIMSSSLEDNGIDTIEEIETSFHIFTTIGWDTIADTDPITVTSK